MSTVNGFQVGSETLKYNYESLDNYNTPNFSTSSSKTYAVGDYVMYNGKLYKCTTATTGGTWVSSSWTLVVLSDDVSNLTRQISDVIISGKTIDISGTLIGNEGTFIYPYTLYKGIKYAYTNNTGAAQTLRLYNDSTSVQIISSNLGNGKTIEFIPVQNCNGIGGYYNTKNIIGVLTVKSILSDLNDTQEDVAENTESIALQKNLNEETTQKTINLFDPFAVLLRKNASGGNASARAISGPIATDGKGITIRAFNLPANLKYEVDYYSSDVLTTPASSSGAWYTDENTRNANSGNYPYVRILFGSVNNAALTETDFDGLEFEVFKEKVNYLQKYISYNSAVDGVIRSIPQKLRVSSFNVGMYTKGNNTGTITDSDILNMRKILCSLDADIIGLQETRETVNSSTEKTEFYNYLYSQISIGSSLGTRGIVSRYQFLENGTGAFTTGRGYQTAKIKVGEKIINFFNFHLSPLVDNRTTEFSEIVSIISNKSYVICTGDFNVGNDTGGGVTEYDTLLNAGFRLANCGYLGRINTFPGSLPRALDNVVVSPDIIIANVESPDIDTTNNPSDHNPIFADLVLI